MLGDERDPNACVGLNNVEHHLGADVLQQILNVVADERVIIDGAPADVETVDASASPSDCSTLWPTDSNGQKIENCM